MLKKIFKITIGIIVILSISLLTYKIDVEIKNSTEETNTVLASFKTSSTSYANKDYSKNPFNIKEDDLIHDLNIYYENKKIRTANGIICKNNRYYIPINEFQNTLGYTSKVSGDKIFMYKESQNVLDYKDNIFDSYFENDLRNPYIKYKGQLYLSIIDLVDTLTLTADWNYDTKEIRFYNDTKILSKEERKKFHRPALIRFEDVTAGVAYTNSDNLKKIRIVSDFMYSREVPFHIAWVPRYMNPAKGIDNDLLKVHSMANADFIYTLDYMISKGGIVGLHGYTHQHGDEESIVGTEFGDKADTSVDYAKQRVEAAVATAKELNIPYVFFESPHYRSTEAQQLVFENYFDYMFEPSKLLYNKKPALSKTNNKTIYVPAPLGYIQNNDADEMMKKLKDKPRDQIAAFFYHPVKEFEYITLSNDKGHPDYEYSQNSILHKLLKSLSDDGYTPVKITDIKLNR